MSKNRVTRRGFLKATGALSTAAAALKLPASNWLEKAIGKAELTTDWKIIPSMCRMCHGTCGVNVFVRNGRVIKVEGKKDAPTNKGTLCPKGLGTVQHQYNPTRLRYPMKRVGERGDGKWERISWDEAYQILQDKFEETWEKYGPQAVALWGGTGRHWRDWSNAVHHALGIGLGVGMPPLCYLPRIEIITKMFGYRIPVADYFGFQGGTPGVVVSWGNNLTYSHPDGMHGSRLLEAVNEGAKFIVIDPVYTNLAQKADIWLPVKPASDTALAMGFLNVIVNEGLYDKEFVEKWSNLPGLVREDNGQMLTMYDLTGEEKEEFHGPPFAVLPPEFLVFWDKEKDKPVIVNGPDVNPAMQGPFDVPLADGTTVTCRTAWEHLVDRVNEYPLDEVAEITWVDVDKIRDAARMMANVPGLALQWGVSFDQWGVNSARGTQAAMILVALTGNLDAPGGMAMWDPPAYRKGSFPGETGMQFVSPELDRWDLVPPEVFGASAPYNVYPLARSHGSYAVRDLAEGKLQLEMLWVQGGNPLVNSMNTQVVYKALQNVPFIVVWDLYMTSTAMISDLVLPIAMWTERDQIGDMHLVWGLQARQKCVEPVGEAKSDEYATLGLIQKMGEKHPHLREAIPWNSVEDWLDWRLEPMGITWDDLKKRWIHYEPQQAYGYKKRGFQLPSGKAELWVRVMKDLSGEALPFYAEPPLFSLSNELAEEFPLLCTTRRVPTYFHSEYRQVPYLRELYPVPSVEINARTAKELGIEDGDWVYIESSVGRIKQRAIVTEGVHPKVVVTQHDWWFPEASDTAPDLGGVFESNMNMITRNDPSQGYDPLSGTPQLRGFLVKVYKATDGPPKGLDPETVYTYTPSEEVE